MARILTDPSEPAHNNINITLTGGWTTVVGFYTTSFGGQTPRKDLNGKGGQVFIVGYGSFNARDTLRSPTGYFTPVNHYFVQCAVSPQASGTVMYVDVRNSGGSNILRVQSNGGGQPWFLTNGVSTLATSSINAITKTWQVIEIEAWHDGSGFAKVWIDGVLAIDYSGAMTAGPAAFFAIGGDDDPFFDDWLVNNITLRYDGGGGTFAPSPGDTVTDGTTGAVATVTAVIGTTTAGYLIVENWNEIAFGDNNTITESGTATTALVDAPSSKFVNGFEPNSGRVRNQFVIAARATGIGTFSELRSINSVDGTQATGTLTASGTPSDGDTVTINGYASQTYTFRTVLSAGPTIPDEVLIGGSAAQAIENLRRAINADGTEGTNYSVGTAVNVDITATDNGAGVLTATSIFYGTAMNSIATTETSANLSWGGATLAGGTGENYEAINDNVVNTATYNQADTANEEDTYPNDSASKIPADANVTCVQGFAYARSSITGIDGLKLSLYDGTTIYYSDRLSLSSSYGQVEFTWNTRPDNDDGWDRSAIIALENGVQFVV